MKKVLFLLLSSFLILAACDNEQESKLDDKKETKSSDKESKKDKQPNEVKKSGDKSNEVATQDTSTEQPTQSQEQVKKQEQQNTQQPVQSQEKLNTQEQQNNNSPVLSQETNNNRNQPNVPVGDAMFGEYKNDGTYCTVGGCLTPQQQKEQEEANYEEMENQGYSREEYDAIQSKGAQLQQQKNNGGISTEEFTDQYLELYD
ncbi:hypothetical protein [Staphylococcus sp. Mo2-1]